MGDLMPEPVKTFECKRCKYVFPIKNEFVDWRKEYDKLREYSSKHIEWLEHKLKAVREVRDRLLDELPKPPDRNCSCHINPPCSDCVDYSCLRELIEEAEAQRKQEAK